MKTWKTRYLAILENGPSGKEDWVFAAELIRDGYAVGQLQVGRGLDTYGEILNLHGWAVTTKGREYADLLASRTAKAKLKARVANLAWGGIGAIVALIGKKLVEHLL